MADSGPTADRLSVLRWSFRTYLVLLGGLGLVTIGWALTLVLVFDQATLASAWFGAAGSGTVLVTALLYRHATAGDAERVIR